MSVHVVVTDVTLPLSVEVDQIYHLACPASPVFYQHNGISTIKTNVLGTMNMLDLANKLKARFLISSTSEVYGDPKVVCADCPSFRYTPKQFDTHTFAFSVWLI